MGKKAAQKNIFSRLAGPVRRPVKPGGIRFVDARLLPSLSNAELVKKAHQSGQMRVVKGGKTPVVLQPVKSIDYHTTNTRDFHQHFGEDRVLVSKGVGSTTYDKIGAKPQHFSFEPRKEYSTQRFWGGMTLEQAKHANYFAKHLKAAFEAAVREKSRAWKIAKQCGVDKIPALEVVSVTKPNRNLLIASTLGKTEINALLKSKKLGRKERNALLFESERGKRRLLEIGAKRALEILGGFPKKTRKNQVVFNYVVSTNQRIANLNSPASPEQLLAANGLIQKGGSWFTKEGAKLTLENAKIFALRKFSASIALGVNLMHTKLNGTFTSYVGKFTNVSSLSPGNITLAGEIVDLDTCEQNTGKREFKKAKELDHQYVQDAIALVADVLWGNSEVFDPRTLQDIANAQEIAQQIILSP